jgi:cell division septation protein DedD
MNRMEIRMMSKAMWCAAILAISPVIAGAQTAPGVNPVYVRAQTLVNDGNATAGRALVDSMIAIAAPGSNEYAEGVYWRAVLAGTAADAEMDYRRVVIDFPNSPRVEDALIRLAQLEIARANYDGALKHLARFAAEHPDSPGRARASYWTARALFDKNDVQGGCSATADALARTGESNTELKNQITYLNQRCAGIALISPAVPPASTATTTTPVIGTPSVTTAPAPITAPPSAPPAASVPVTVPAPVQSAPPVDSATVVAKVIVPEKVPETVKPPVKVKEPVSAPASSSERVFSVQVAAYNVKSQADAMVAKLKKSGYEARVDGTSAPFRVRIGKYASQTQASAVQRSLKAKQITGFVVQADIR